MLAAPLKLIAVVLLTVYVEVIDGVQRSRATFVVTRRGLNYVLERGMEFLKETLIKTDIPGETGESVTVVGKVKYAITGAKIHTFVPGVTDSQVDPKNGLSVTIKGMEIGCQATIEYSYKKFFISFSDKSNFVATSKTISLVLAFDFGVSNQGKMVLSSVQCSCTVDKMKVKMGGKLSILYSIILYFAENRLKKKIAKTTCEKIKEGVMARGNAKLANITYKGVINEFLTVDYSLTERPVGGNDLLEIRTAGRFINDTVDEGAPEMKPILSRMAGAAISEATFNSLLRVSHRASAFTHEFSFKDAGMAKAVYSLLKGQELENGQGIGLNLTLNVTQAPRLTIRSDSMAIDTYCDLNLYLLNTSTTKLKLYGLALDVSFKAKPVVTDTTVFCIIDGYNTTVLAGTSSRGRNAKLTDIFLRILDFIMPEVNDRLAKGLVLPTHKGYRIVNPVVNLRDRYIALGFSLDYDGLS